MSLPERGGIRPHIEVHSELCPLPAWGGQGWGVAVCPYSLFPIPYSLSQGFGMRKVALIIVQPLIT